jgi:hypothetical protein
MIPQLTSHLLCDGESSDQSRIAGSVGFPRWRSLGRRDSCVGLGYDSASDRRTSDALDRTRVILQIGIMSYKGRE